MEPRLCVLVPVAQDRDLVVDGHELDVAVARLLCGADGFLLIFGGVPVDFEIVGFLFLVERGVHGVDNLFVSAALEGDHLAEVVET